MKIVTQDCPVGVSHHRAERLRHAHPKMASASRRLSTRARKTGKGGVQLQCDGR
jgi:hypothetical protein